MIAETQPKLTARQLEVLEWMRQHPGFSYREAMDSLGFRSTNSVTEYVRMFEGLGLIERRPGARGIRVVDGGDAVGELVDAVRDALLVCEPTSLLSRQALSRLAERLQPFGGVKP